MRHIISILVENEAGALSRISNMFSARGYNIESLTVAPTEDASLSRMTVVTAGSEDVIEQITKQLNKLVEVVKVVDLSEAEHIEREMMLIKVRAGAREREDMKRMADIFRGRIIDVSDNTYTIELTGEGRKLDAFIQALDQGAIIETVRTGASGIGRGNRVLGVLLGGLHLRVAHHAAGAGGDLLVALAPGARLPQASVLAPSPGATPDHRRNER